MTTEFDDLDPSVLSDLQGLWREVEAAAFMAEQGRMTANLQSPTVLYERAFSMIHGSRLLADEAFQLHQQVQAIMMLMLGVALERRRDVHEHHGDWPNGYRETNDSAS